MLKLELFMDFGKYTIHHLDKHSDSSIHVTSGMTSYPSWVNIPPQRT